MPEINQNTSIKITPERFLNACSAEELYELDLLLQRRYYQKKIESLGKGYKANVSLAAAIKL